MVKSFLVSMSVLPHRTHREVIEETLTGFKRAYVSMLLVGLDMSREEHAGLLDNEMLLK